MGFHGIKPVIFLLNNGGYGVEYELELGRPRYNQIPTLRYSQLPEVMGCQNWLTRTVTTNAELEEAMAAIKAEPDRAAYIEVVVPAEENVSLPDKVIEHIYKLKTPNAMSVNP